MVFFFILILAILFIFIVESVEDYVAPAIVYLSKFLGMSESLAGVTLIAFANGAGDVLTAIVASDSEEGISYNVGALYGAGLFVLTFVVAMTILASPKPIEVLPSLLFREIGFYIIATLFTIFTAYLGVISIMTSVILLGIYITLVLIVIV